MSATCKVCQDRRYTPCPAQAVTPTTVCAFCGGRNLHHQMPCRACNKNGGMFDHEALKDLLGFDP